MKNRMQPPSHLSEQPHHCVLCEAIATGEIRAPRLQQGLRRKIRQQRNRRVIQTVKSIFSF